VPPQETRKPGDLTRRRTHLQQDRRGCSGQDWLAHTERDGQRPKRPAGIHQTRAPHRCRAISRLALQTERTGCSAARTHAAVCRSDAPVVHHSAREGDHGLEAAAELGTDMNRALRMLCPGNCESAGKRQSSKKGKGNRSLRRNLIQNAWRLVADGGVPAHCEASGRGCCRRRPSQCWSSRTISSATAACIRCISLHLTLRTARRALTLADNRS
jgi:hypothetical protein